jgi:hypothetical protein
MAGTTAHQPITPSRRRSPALPRGDRVTRSGAGAGGLVGDEDAQLVADLAGAAVVIAIAIAAVIVGSAIWHAATTSRADRLTRSAAPSVGRVVRLEDGCWDAPSLGHTLHRERAASRKQRRRRPGSAAPLRSARLRPHPGVGERQRVHRVRARARPSIRPRGVRRGPLTAAASAASATRRARGGACRDRPGGGDEGGERRAQRGGFSLDGTAYEIDLTDENAAALRAALAPFIAAARSVSARPPPARCRRGHPRADARFCGP